jgi:hypothetical protein
MTEIFNHANVAAVLVLASANKYTTMNTEIIEALPLDEWKKYKQQ